MIVEIISNTKDGNSVVQLFNSTLSDILDKHDPKISITNRPVTPWYTNTITDAKKLRRKAERVMVRVDFVFIVRYIFSIAILSTISFLTSRNEILSAENKLISGQQKTLS